MAVAIDLTYVIIVALEKNLHCWYVVIPDSLLEEDPVIKPTVRCVRGGKSLVPVQY